jgi:gamma-glutamyltranspeptidase/glutathione hydrolase
MTDMGLVETWEVRKPALESAAGLVASHHHVASDVGARILAQGGNAVDAAIATGLAIGVVEPWMSGLGGIGYMLVHVAKERRTHVVDFNTHAPKVLDPATYPLSGGMAGDLFGWPAVEDDRNMRGYHAIALPSYVAGIALALERFGTLGWSEVLAPAIEIAEQGLPCDWYATHRIATGARELAEYPESRRIYLPGGFPPVGEWGGPTPTIPLGNLAKTLRRLADAGPRDFYEGEIAYDIAADLADGGASLSADDLGGFEADVMEAESISYRGATVHTAPGLNAGPSLHQVLGILRDGLDPRGAPGIEAFGAYARSLLATYAHRLAHTGHGGEGGTPACTTHFGTVDAEGNTVALTQTLLSLFGSKVVLPRTGILMNNSIISFDPRPGGPNSIAAGRRPLSNMCPAIVERADGCRFAIGGSGGRRILPAVLQLISFLVDYGMSVDEAIHHPRIDVSGTATVTLDERLPAAVIDDLSARFSTRTAPQAVYPTLYAMTNVVAHDPNRGHNMGGAYVMSPLAKVSVGI